MDYERIEKRHQGGGGFSPVKLRNMLLGIEKKRRGEEEDQGSAYSLSSSHVNVMDTRGVSASEEYKDVDIISKLPDCSTSNTMSGERRSKESVLVNSRIRSLEECSSDYESGYDSATVSSVFEFQKSDHRAPPRVPFVPFSKTAPSKWDDAQKWIASPTSNRNSKASQPQIHGAQGVALRKPGILGYTRQSSTKIVTEVPEQRTVHLEEPDTKRMDSSQVTKEASGGPKIVSWLPDQYPIVETYVKPAVMIKTSVEDSAISLSQHDSSISVHSTTTTYIPPPSTVRSVSMRDMGTEMTPIASQDPSRTGTPVGATTPTRSPTSSRPSTPGKGRSVSTSVDTSDFCMGTSKNELSEKELQKRTRREIMALGTQLGKMNIAAWASKEEEEKDASSSLKIISTNDTPKNLIETRAAAWEEAEKAKYLARYKREEIKILTWENHQKTKMEAEMRNVEVEVERLRAKAHDKLMEKLAAARNKVEQKRAAAEAKKNSQAAKTEQQSEYIRRTGRFPSLSCFSWCY